MHSPPHPPTHTHRCLWTHCDDIKEVIISQCVQYGGHRLPGDGQPEAFHTSAHVHQNDHVLWRGGGLDVPLPVPAVKGYDPIFIRPPLDSLKKELVHTLTGVSAIQRCPLPPQCLAVSLLPSLPGYCLKKPLALPKYCHISEGSRSKLSTKTLFKASDQNTPLTMAESAEIGHKWMNQRSLLSLKQKVLQYRTQKHQHWDHWLYIFLIVWKD